MASDVTTPESKVRRWSGPIVSGLPVLFLLFDGIIKLLQIPPVEESFVRLGYPATTAPAIGMLELACLAVYVFPRTSTIGAILLTGFLGGATATHVRVGDPLLTHVLFPSFVGMLLWGGLILRDRGARAVLSRTWHGRSRRTARITPARRDPPGASGRAELADCRSTCE